MAGPWLSSRSLILCRLQKYFASAPQHSWERSLLFAAKLSQPARPADRAPAEPFSLLEGTRTIVHRQFHRLKSLAQKFDEQFKIKIETVAFKLQSIKAVTSENLEHGERVAQALPEQHVDHGGEKPVAEINKQA